MADNVYQKQNNVINEFYHKINDFKTRLMQNPKIAPEFKNTIKYCMDEEELER